VAITGAGIREALDGRCNRNRHRPGIAFASKGREGDSDGRLLSTDNEVGNADRRALELSGSEVRVHANACPDEANDRRGICVDRCRRNVLIPKVVRREGNKTAETSPLAERQGAAGGSLRIGTGGRCSAACHGECQEGDAEIEHFAHVFRHTGSNAIREVFYSEFPFYVPNLGAHCIPAPLIATG